MSEIKCRPEIQMLYDVEDAGEDHWLRIYCKFGEVFEAYADCMTTTTIGDDEDVDAMLFVRRDGNWYVVAGVDIDHFEILEPR